MKLAQEKELDLVIIAEKTEPPVAKILDFNKFLYEENKKKAQAKAKSKKSKLKEFKFGPTISGDAIETRVRRSREFLNDGNRVRLTVTLKGREMAYPELGVEKLNQFVVQLSDIAKAEGEIKQIGRNISVTLVRK